MTKGILLSYNKTLDYLYSLQWHGIAPGLERITLLLSLLHHPHQRFPSIHIGGTNGKGSTAAMAASILRQAGYRVGLYTSPHLIDFSERMTINGVPISKEEIVRWTERIRSKIDPVAMKITFFEFTTALAFCYFAEANLDIAVVEVGLGGRFDATNVLTPWVTAITQIDLDHERYLGATVLEIAKEKAGIIKAGIPLVTGATQPQVLAHFQEVTASKAAPLIRLGQEIIVEGDSSETFRYRGHRERKVHCPLWGKHQMENAAVAIGVIEQLPRSLPVQESAILEGIRHVQWPGRLEVIQTDPLVLVDGAHNPGGARALAAFLRQIDPDRLGRHILIAGILRDKDIQEILAPLTGWADEMALTRPDIERAADPAQLSAVLPPSIKKTVYETIPAAINAVLSRMEPFDTLVITGSLYTVGEALAHFKGVTLSPLRG